MATSSILDNIEVHNPMVIEEYVAAMERMANEPPKRRGHKETPMLTDSEQIRAIMKKGIQSRREREA